MSNYYISQIQERDTRRNQQMNDLLVQENIRRDALLDYSCGLYDEDQLIATGSCYGNTLRCLAVSSDHQGEALMNQIVSHLIEIQFARGNTHLFLYTKDSSAPFFGSLGFYEIARIKNQLVFMENRKTGFSTYLKGLAAESKSGAKTAAIVMNANPFTLGHRYLVEKAAAENDVLHLFMVSEDVSLIPFAVRKRLILEGTAHLKNLVYHDCGPYIISNATFPSYFQKDEAAVIEGHARLDLTIFIQIARTLGITCRYVGEEPFSQVTGIYNTIMTTELPEAGVECVVIPRLESDGQAISASTVRNAIKQHDLEGLSRLVPASTLDYLCSAEAAPVIEKIRTADDVVHY